MIVIETARLRLRTFTPDDAAFVHALVNDPDWLRFIGDRGVRTLDDARRYIENGPVAMMAREGFGLWVVERRADGTPIGMCGLIRRDGLNDVDIGFAFLAPFRGQGFAKEAAEGTLRHAHDVLGMSRLIALTSPDNVRSIALLTALGFAFERTRELKPGDVVNVYGREAEPRAD